MDQNSSGNYAHLPEELLGKILENVPNTVNKMNGLFDIQDEPIKAGMEDLRQRGMIVKLSGTDFSNSLMAADGGMILEKMTGTDIILAVAVGVEGLTEDGTQKWGAGKNQFYQWQTVLPHDEANARLVQGVMFLMELSVLANADHEIRIMDGTHFTPIIKINSLLSADGEKIGPVYTDALKEFLRVTYKKIIPDIPDIIKAAFNDDKIIALAKYSSSRDVIDAFLTKHNIHVDDKTFFSLALGADEYLTPLSVGQSEEERRKTWDDLRINSHLELPPPEQEALNKALIEAINPMRTKDRRTGKQKASEIFYTYYKPFEDGPAYKIEIKKGLAEDHKRLERYLLSIKKQIVFPEIREPYPQYLVDLMAKSVAGGMFAIQEAIRLSPDLKLDKGKFNLLFNYRT